MRGKCRFWQIFVKVSEHSFSPVRDSTSNRLLRLCYRDNLIQAKITGEGGGGFLSDLCVSRLGYFWYQSEISDGLEYH